MTVVAIWLGWHLNVTRRQKQLVDRVLNLGGKVQYDHQLSRDARGRNLFDSTAKPGAPAWLVSILGIHHFQNVASIDLSNTGAADAELWLIGRVPSIESVSLTSTKITNEGLRHLASLDRLRYLSLWKTGIDDDGVAYLAGHSHLHTLILDKTKVSDAGLVHLRDLAELEEWLGLRDTAITDAGLPNLKNLHKLRNLNVIGTGVTEAGAKSIQESMPKAMISLVP
jgi:hypothetical protein